MRRDGAAGHPPETGDDVQQLALLGRPGRLPLDEGVEAVGTQRGPVRYGAQRCPPTGPATGITSTGHPCLRTAKSSACSRVGKSVHAGRPGAASHWARQASTGAGLVTGVMVEILTNAR